MVQEQHPDLARHIDILASLIKQDPDVLRISIQILEGILELDRRRADQNNLESTQYGVLEEQQIALPEHTLGLVRQIEQAISDLLVDHERLENDSRS